MSLPDSFRRRFSVPVIASPMFLISGPELVIACCKAGVAGTFPSLNTRTSEGFGEWLDTIGDALRTADGAQPYAPYGVNLILHPTNERQDADLEVLVAHRVPFVITSLGNPQKVVRAVHAYGGLVFSDVIHAKHARKAIEAGVDGLIAVGNGAGGHAGTQSLFSLARELRGFWDGAMVLDSTAEDVVYTDAVSGTHANMLLKSLFKAYGPDWRQRATERRLDGPKAWRDVWSAGQGVAIIHDVPSTAELVARLRAEYLAAVALTASPALSRMPETVHG